MNTRREFLQLTSAATGALALGFPSLNVLGANQKLSVGLIGPGGMGMNHLRTLLQYPDVTVAWVCDPDERHRLRAAREVEQNSGAVPQSGRDLRQVLADPSVDAVVIATPDHWHVPAALLALEAGKHVYVEKPCSHNVREGRRLVDAAQRTQRVVQVGTQTRSADHIREGINLLREGAIGEVLIAKAWNSQRRSNIGHAKPSNPPAELDYDLWVGPAPMVPYQSNLLHSSWRWFLAFGCGDAGNDGVHELDIARWGLGVEAHPNTITALGGKYFFDDDQQFPDTQYAAFEYETGASKKQLIYEHRIWSPYVQEGHENGNAFYGTEGVMILGKQTGWQLYGPRNQLLQEKRGSLSLSPHHRNFFDSVRSGRKPNADAETGHLSAALAHFANIAVRAASTLQFDPAREQFASAELANAWLGREYRPNHWAALRNKTA